MNKYVFLIILFLIGGCRREVQQIKYTLDGCTTIHIPAAEKFEADKMIDSVTLIKLEASDSSLFGYINKIRVYKGFIYILDRRFAKALFIFDKSGKHVKTIQNPGRGPREFISIVNFEINPLEDEIMVMDNYGRKFGFFDLEGNYLREAPSKIEVLEAVSLPGGVIVHAKHESSFWKNGKPEGSDKIFYTNEKGEILKSLFPYEDNAKITFMLEETIVAHSDSSYTYAPRFRDTIYNLTDKGLIPRYALHFNDATVIPERILQNEDQKVITELIQEGKNCFLGYHLESSYWLYLSINYWEQLCSTFYSKRTGKITTFKAYTKEEGTNVFLDPLFVTDEYFWTALTYHELKKYGLDSLLSKYSLTMDDNPYLIRYRLKDREI